MTDGVFDHAKWRDEMNKLAAASGHGLASAINDGAAFAHHIIDEPHVDREAMARFDRLKAKLAARRRRRRVLPWLALAVFLLLALASVARAQMTPNGRPLILWSPPLVIGMYTIDSARVDDALPEIATADWPAFADTVIYELRLCTGLRGGMEITNSDHWEGWQLRTVARGVFSVSTYSPDEGWHADDAYIGFTFPHVKRIYVVQEGLRYRGLVKHELLHALLADHGFDPRHGTPVADAMFKRCVPEKPR